MSHETSMNDPRPPSFGPSRADGNDQPIFQALLTPYRSLGKRGFTIMMASIGFVSFVTGLWFVSHGAWPVFGFFGLDIFLIWWAFRANYRAANAREEVRVSRTDLAIRKTAANGAVREYHHNPAWARFNVARHDEMGIVGMRVLSEGRATELGQCLNPDDRESFATAFRRALNMAKGA